MNKTIHPAYAPLAVTCSCGNAFETGSTLQSKTNSLHIEVCSQCHPFYTGTEKFIDTAGRIEKFSERFSKFSH
jgi:large subunit ribosomal protein L31